MAGPLRALEELGARSWGPSRLLDWPSGRYALFDVPWTSVRRAAAEAIWYFPHWDVPFFHPPARFVVTIHDVAHLRLNEVSRTKAFLARRWMDRTLAQADWVTTISQFSARELRSEWPDVAQKLSIVPNGVDEAFFAAAPSLPADLGARMKGTAFMLSVGIRKERKNLRVGIDLLRAIPGLNWVVVGELFPEWARVEAAARDAGLLERIITLDRQPETTIRALYRNAAFLLFPSRYEGFGLPILEAFAAGTPVLASNVTSIPEVAGDAGWLCDPDDVPCFVRSARDILDLGTRRAAIAERGVARARGFSWERAAEGLADAFRAVARG